MQDITSLRGHVFTEEHMGMLTDYELMASCLAGGLGVTRERLESTLGRLIRPSPLGYEEEPEKEKDDSGNPLNTTAIKQAMRELTDIWQGFFQRPDRFKEVERILITLKDRIVDSFGFNAQALMDYHRLAQSLNDLKLSGNNGNTKPL
jgi:hypothetical protein